MVLKDFFEFERMLIFYFCWKSLSEKNLDKDLTDQEKEELKSKSENIQLKKCLSSPIIKINSFQFVSMNHMRGFMLTIAFDANLEGKVEKPFIEFQIIQKDNHIPIFRTHEHLCRPTILQCPASFSHFSYSTQFPLPSRAKPGNYILKLIFREKDKVYSCYEGEFQISDDIPSNFRRVA